MAYSRWSNSRWYTFWACGESLEYKIPLQVIKDNQVFLAFFIKFDESVNFQLERKITYEY